MQKHLLSEKDKREFLSRVKEKYGWELNGIVEIGKEKKEVYYFIDGLLAFFSEELIPTICLIQKFKLNMPSVTIDEGAVKHVVKGADLFAPGIVSYDCECKEGDIVLVKTKTGLPVSIIKVVMSKEKAMAERKGKFGINLHYVSDKIWDMCNVRSSSSNV